MTEYTQSEKDEAAIISELDGISMEAALEYVRNTRAQVELDRAEVDHLRWADEGTLAAGSASDADECESCQ